MNDYEFDYLIFIARCEPPHLAHIQITKEGLKRASKVIVLLGSAFQPRTHKNPFTWMERETMIRASLPEPLNDRVIVRPLRDKASDEVWAAQVQQIVASIADSSNIGIIGHKKDHTSYYLEMFPQWGPNIEVPNIEDMHSTDIRIALFEAEDVDDFDLKIGRNLPSGIHDWLKAWMLSPEYEKVRSEYHFNKRYKRAWDWNATLDAFIETEVPYLPEGISPKDVINRLRDAYCVAPYSNNYYCSDAVVVQSGHVLLIRRRAEPGRSLWALPGGHIDKDEVSFDAAIRELREETGLKVPDPVLRGSLDKKNPTHLFEKPDRSLRGRTLSKAYYFVLKPGPLPKVKGGDDAEKAKWIPLSTVAKMEEQLFEDHFHIIQYFLGEL